jgi:hypothetical protein
MADVDEATDALGAIVAAVLDDQAAVLDTLRIKDRQVWSM